MIPLTFPSCRQTREFLTASSTCHENSIGSFALVFIHAHLDKVTDAREKENPMKDLAGLDGKSVNIRRSPGMTNGPWVDVLAMLAECRMGTIQLMQKHSVWILREYIHWGHLNLNTKVVHILITRSVSFSLYNEWIQKSQRKRQWLWEEFDGGPGGPPPVRHLQVIQVQF